jgi:glutamine amidotransferase
MRRITDVQKIADCPSYMTYLTDSSEDDPDFELEHPLAKMVSAMQRTVATVVELQQTIIGNDRAPNSLNLCASDGIKLVAIRCRNHATSQPPSLYYSSKAGTTLNRKFHRSVDGRKLPGMEESRKPAVHGTHLIVASEPSTYEADEWELIGKNQCITVDGSGKFEVQDMEYDEQWNAETPP